MRLAASILFRSNMFGIPCLTVLEILAVEFFVLSNYGYTDGLNILNELDWFISLAEGLAFICGGGNFYLISSTFITLLPNLSVSFFSDFTVWSVLLACYVFWTGESYIGEVAPSITKIVFCYPSPVISWVLEWTDSTNFTFYSSTDFNSTF